MAESPDPAAPAPHAAPPTLATPTGTTPPPGAAAAPIPRSAGALLHVTSLPGSPGIGDLGPAAERFVDTLQAAALRWWQVLPLGPTAFGDSPYQSPSTFAGNPLLLSPERLVEDGLLSAASAVAIPKGDPARVDFPAVIAAKRTMLAEVHRAFTDGKGPAELRAERDAFREREAGWLADYAVFAAIHEEQGREWTRWPEPLRDRDRAALREAQARLATAIDRIELTQFLFDRQLRRLRAYAAGRGVGLFGDLPIFAAHDSADVWANRALFDLHPDGTLRHLSGAPPDAFTDDGQLWGNPLYRWEELEHTGFRWWIDRVRSNLDRFDLLRLDHFRGFAACWTVPGGETTARNGVWQPVPGRRLFAALKNALGPLPFVAEDLGDITPDVIELRKELGFPGMKVMLWAFGGDPKLNEHAFHQHRVDDVVYTGSHDNETVRGWFEDGIFTSAKRPREEAEAERARVLLLTGGDGTKVHEDFVRMALLSPAALAVLNVPDILGLGNEARMNVPGRREGNWGWRLDAGAWTDSATAHVGTLVQATGRRPAP